MADNPMPPVVPQLTLPVPQRKDPTNFRPRADVLMTELPLVVDGINAASIYIQGAKMDVASMEGIRDATQQIKEDTLIAADGKIAVMDGIRDDASQSATAAAAYAAAAGQAAGLPEFLEGTEGKPMTRMRDGSGVHFSQEYTPFITVTSATQLVAGERYRVDTSSGTFNLLLPASPFTGATVFLFDARGTWKETPATLKRNGRTIMGLSEDMMLDVDFQHVTAIYDGADWRVFR